MIELIYNLFGFRYVPCHNCETLKTLLADEKKKSDRLLEQLIKPPVEPVTPQNESVPVKSIMSIPDLKRRLEFKHRIDKETAQKVAEVKQKLQTVDELEEELLGLTHEA